MKSEAYIPAFETMPTIRETDVIEHGVLVAVSPDGKTGVAQVTIAPLVSLVRVTIDESNKITGLVQRLVNTFVANRIAPVSPHRGN